MTSERLNEIDYRLTAIGLHEALTLNGREMLRLSQELLAALRAEGAWVPVGEWRTVEGDTVLIRTLNKRHNVSRTLRGAFYSEFKDWEDDGYRPGWYEESFEGETAHFISAADLHAELRS